MTTRINAADVFPSPPEHDGEITPKTVIEVPSLVPCAPTTRASRASVLRSDSPSCDVNAVFDGLDEALESCRTATYETRMTMLISACIERGMNTRGRIRGVAKRKKLNVERTSKFLTESTGTLWRRAKDGTYSLVI